MKNFFAEFKKFISRGSAIDLAVGVIIGGAFTSIVTSLNTDIITPILGIFGGVDFTSLKLTLGDGANAPVLAYGNFLTALVNFLITAFVIFSLMRVLNNVTSKLKKTEEEKPAAPTTKKCPYCLSDIPLQATRCPHCTSEVEA